MSRIYRVTVTAEIDLYVEAADEDAAAIVAVEHADDEHQNHGRRWSADAVHLVAIPDEVTPDWRGVIPYGGADDDERPVQERIR